MKDFSETNSAVQERWNANSSEWARQIRSGQDVYRHEFLEPLFMEFLGNIAGLEVLDGGCGEGTSSRVLARAGAKVSAIDLSQEMVQNARQFEASTPLGIEFHQGSAAETPFPDAKFDLVTSWMALSDMSCYAEAIKEFARVLKPGGRLAFCIRHPSYFTRRMAVVRRAAGQPPYLLVGDYFDKEPWLEKWSFSGGQEESEGRKTFSNIRFPFTLGDCINGVADAGLVIKAVSEPTPSAQLCAKHPRLQFWSRHAALYLFLSAVKPGA